MYITGKPHLRLGHPLVTSVPDVVNRPRGDLRVEGWKSKRGYEGGKGVSVNSLYR